MPAITLEQLTAICDEIAAVSRAGLPLDRGLADASAEFSGKLSKLTEDFGKRIQAGERLEEILTSQMNVFPPAFGAVLEVGVRSGNLPHALEAISQSARTLADLRNTVRIAWVYPYFLIATAYLVLWFMLQTLPAMWDFFQLIDLPLQRWEVAGRWIAAQHAYWYPVVGVGLLLWIVWDVWSMSRRGVLFDHRWDVRMIGSGWKSARRLSQQATFCELCALLLEHQIPLPTTLRLAARGSDPTSARDIEETCQHLESGNRLAIENSSLSPLVKCVLLTGGPQETLAARMRKIAGYFRREAEAKVAWGAIRLPMLVALVVGGTIVIVYAATFWGPWLRVLHRLMEPNL